MAYKLRYSDYPGTEIGPPDPERWVGPQGPPGPQGIPGPVAEGGPFLPLSGGTVTGPTSFANVSYNMLASGAVGDGITDDTAKIQTFLNTLPIGAEVVLPATKQFLIDSADLTLPFGITICGQGAMEPTAAVLVGPAFILNPSYRIVVQGADCLSNFKILRKGLLSAPTTAQSNAAVAAWAAEAPLRKTSASTASGTTLPFSNTSGITVGMRALGNEIGAFNATVTAVVANTSVTFSSVTGPYPIAAGSYVRFGNSVALHLAPNQAGITLDRLFITGFNTAIASECGRIFADIIEADCTTALYATRGGDASYISRVHCIPNYGGDFGKRPGPCFLLTRTDGWHLQSCTAVGWVNSFVLSNVGGVTLNRCWAEPGFADGVTVSTGIKTELWITNQNSFINCVSGGSVAFDFQHGGGSANAIGCSTAMAAGDATSIAHYRLGPSSVGQITSAQMVAGGVKPFVVQPGVIQWQIINPMIINIPTPWITGAAADLANVAVVGGPGPNGHPNSLEIDLGDALVLQPSGKAVNVGGPMQCNPYGITFNDLAGTSTDFSMHLQFYPGYGINAQSGGRLNLVTGSATYFVVGSTDIASVWSDGLHLVKGFGAFGSTIPATKPTVTGSKGANAALASLLTALASYGLVTDSST